MTEHKKQLGYASGIIKPYFCGGVSAMFASCCIHPIDMVKVRLQLLGAGSSTARPSAVSVAKGIVAQDGVKGLYNGLSASLTRQATYGTARIGLYTAFADKVRHMEGVGGAKGDKLPLGWKFLCGFTSGAIASCIGNPFDVSLVRMQSDGMLPVNQRRNYKSVFDAVSRIVREEGFSALYWGYRPTLMRAIAMNIGMMASYDQAKETIIAFRGEGTVTDLLSAASAGFFCAFFSLPFDLMKTRLQNQKAGPDGVLPYKGVIDCSSKILRNEGFPAFWRGFGAYYGRCAPHAMVILITREQVTWAYDELLGE